MRDRYPLVSFILTSYNYAHLITECIDSILAQRYENFELIIMDDVSTDNTLAVLEPYKADRRVKIFVNEKNLGLIENYRAAAKIACGEFITAGSPDEKYMPNHIERLIAPALDPVRPADFVWGNIFHVVPGGRGFSYQQYHKYYFPTDGRNEYAHILSDFYVCGGSTLFRRDVYEELGSVDPFFKACSEFELPLRFARAGKRIAHVPYPTTTYLVHDDQYSQTTVYRNQLYCEYLEMLQRYVVPENAWRIRGYEVRMLEKLFDLLRYPEAAVREQSATKHAELEARIRGYAAAPPPARPQAQPRVSIIAVCDASYDAVRDFIAAAGAQTYTDWELIIYQYGIVSMEALAQADALHVKIRHIYVPTANAATARQQAVEHICGELITYFEEGVELSNTHLERLVAGIDQTAAHVMVAQTDTILYEGGSARYTASGASGIAQPYFDQALNVALMTARSSIMHRFDLFNFVPKIDGVRASFYESRAPVDIVEFLLRVRHASLEVRAAEGIVVRRHIDAPSLFQDWQRYAQGNYIPKLMQIYQDYPIADERVRDVRITTLEKLTLWTRASSGTEYQAGQLQHLVHVLSGAAAIDKLLALREALR